MYPHTLLRGLRVRSGYYPIGCSPRQWHVEGMETTEQTQRPKTSPPRPRLERLRDDRAVAGVASGLARYFGIDVAWIRIGFVVLALFGGTGILLYLIGWLAIPEEGTRDSIATDKQKWLDEWLAHDSGERVNPGHFFKALRARLNEDAMATEKLAEGIRSFTKDTLRLEGFACQTCMDSPT